jgi:hypothetical protein
VNKREVIYRASKTIVAANAAITKFLLTLYKFHRSFNFIMDS